MRFFIVVSSFVSIFSFALIIGVIALIIVNNGYNNDNTRRLLGLVQQLQIQQPELVNIYDTIIIYQNNITFDFNETNQINNTLAEYADFLSNYTCQQIERINNATPPCNGTFFVSGAGNITINNAPQHGITINGTAFVLQLDQNQNTIDVITTLLALTDAQLMQLDEIALKTINNVTVDGNNNINIVGECGVEINITNSGIMISTCDLENNATDLVIFLNQTYYDILNQTNTLNSTFITIQSILQQLETQISILQGNLVTNINGVYGTNHNVNVYAGTKIAINGVTINNTGIVSVNNINLNRNVDIVQGDGITVSTDIPSSTITIANTIANVVANPCINTVVTSGLVVSYNFFSLAWQFTQWATFPNETKSYISCPTVFSTQGFIQPEGIWKVQLNIPFNCGVPSACFLCSFSLTIGLIDSVTSEAYPILTQLITLDVPNSQNIAGASSTAYMVGQRTFDSNVIPIGRELYFRVYFTQTQLGSLSWNMIPVTISATRVG